MQTRDAAMTATNAGEDILLADHWALCVPFNLEGNQRKKKGNKKQKEQKQKKNKTTETRFELARAHPPHIRSVAMWRLNHSAIPSANFTGLILVITFLQGLGNTTHVR